MSLSRRSAPGARRSYQRLDRPALLAFSEPPSPDVFGLVAACASNLRRELLATTVRVRPGSGPGDSAIASDQSIAMVVGAADQANAAVIAVSGSTTAAVVRILAAATGCLVLIARARHRWRSVLAATDLLTPGLPVVTAATELASRAGAIPEVLHNIAPGWAPPSVTPRPDDLVTRGMEQRLSRLATLAEDDQAAPRVVVSCLSTADRAIVHAANDRGADLLVVGMHHPGGPEGTGCADLVVCGTTGNVLVVPLGGQWSMSRATA